MFEPESPPPGWYDDGQHPGQQRWWDGKEWTEQYQLVLSAAAPGPAPVSPAPQAQPEAAPGSQPFASASAPASAEPQYPFRLLADEVVLGTFPIARKQRPLGKLVSFLFVTDSRVIYAAEAKSVASSSTHTKEFQVPTIQGIEVGRHVGLDALGLVAAIGTALNFLGLVIGAIVVATSGGGSGGAALGSAAPDFSQLGAVLGVLAVGSLIVGAVVVFVLLRPKTDLKVIGPQAPQTLSGETDVPRLLAVLLLFLVFGLFIGTALILWVIIRELGVFRADDAQYYATPANVDRIAHEAGALILDVQARGKLAGAE